MVLVMIVWTECEKETVQFYWKKIPLLMKIHESFLKYSELT